MDTRELATDDNRAVSLELDGVHIGPYSSYVLDIRGLAILNSGAEIEGPIQRTVWIEPGDASSTGIRHVGETAPDQDLSGRVVKSVASSPLGSSRARPLAVVPLTWSNCPPIRICHRLRPMRSGLRAAACWRSFPWL